MKLTRYTLAEINALGSEEFTRVLGGVFEHSPWVAEATWAQRPFPSREALHEAMCRTVRNTSEEQKLALIRAHPDLVGRAALEGTLTAASAQEQSSAGLDKLTPSEVALFQKHNQAYFEKFGFPFVICARLNKKEAILWGFAERLDHLPHHEVQTALAEIYKIAELRLCDLLH